MSTLTVEASAGRASNDDVGTTDLEEGVIEANLGEPSVVTLESDRCALSELREIERLTLRDGDSIESNGGAARRIRGNSSGVDGTRI